LSVRRLRLSCLCPSVRLVLSVLSCPSICLSCPSCPSVVSPVGRSVAFPVPVGPSDGRTVGWYGCVAERHEGKPMRKQNLILLSVISAAMLASCVGAEAKTSEMPVQPFGSSSEASRASSADSGSKASSGDGYGHEGSENGSGEGTWSGTMTVGVPEADHRHPFREGDIRK
jgi:hypothetical protein